MNQALQLYELSLLEEHPASHAVEAPVSHRESLSTIDDLCFMLSESYKSADYMVDEKEQDDDIDPLIGTIICVPRSINLDRGTRRNSLLPGITRTISKDKPISMSASGRNVTRRRHSLAEEVPFSVPISISPESSSNDVTDGARIHSRARQESYLSLPAMASSYEDRFAGSSTTMHGKVDKLLPTPVKRRRDVVSHTLASSAPPLPPMLV